MDFPQLNPSPLQIDSGDISPNVSASDHRKNSKKLSKLPKSGEFLDCNFVY
jgi:hypothetical protein